MSATQIDAASSSRSDMLRDVREKKAAHTPEYAVTEDGRVFSVTSNWRGYGERELRQSLNADGYPSVRLMTVRGRVRYAVHRLVAMAYLDPRPSPQHQIRHLDGNKSNNHCSNLAWGTAAENAADREMHGRTSRGERHSALIKAGNQALIAKMSRGHEGDYSNV